MFSWYKYLIVSLVFSHLGFWSGNLFLIAPFPDLCLLVPLNSTFLLSIYFIYLFIHFFHIVKMSIFQSTMMYSQTLIIIVFNSEKNTLKLFMVLAFLFLDIYEERGPTKSRLNL